MPTEINLAADLAAVIEQEATLVFDAFNEDDALRLGSLTREVAAAAGQAITIVVRLAGSPVYVSAMPGTAPANYYWANRKANLTELYGQSSYRLGLEGKISGNDVLDVAGLSRSEYASHGGCFPIRTRDTGLVGSITVSGLPQREDHILVTAAVAAYLGRGDLDFGLAR